ncbi:MAG: hypothetical protein HFE75_15780 [Firmicutes bacterium]|jgi:anti-sigma28 factor (negative regulator of flagellin synthesis)|nr:hypothetical protein [Bacillota bacterium]NBI63829.1 hypothetical protein [Clostridiales bacterium]
MKISIDSATNAYLNPVNTAMKNSKSASVSENGKKFDQIMINTNSRQIAEEKLEEAAKKEVASQVFQTASDERVAALKEQVSQGIYKIDPEAIAGRILLTRGTV